MRSRRWGTLVIIGMLAVLPAGSAEAKKKKKVKLGPVVTQAQTVSVPAGLFGAATASCPAGTALVGGGFASMPTRATGGSNFVLESRRSGNTSWTVRTYNTSALLGTLTVEAYCRKGAPLLSEQSDSVTVPGAMGFVLTQGNPAGLCPGGTRAVAGGFTGNSNAAGFYQGTLPIAAFRFTEASFQASAVNTATTPKDFTALAYCSRSGGRSEVTATAPTNGLNVPVTADTPVCPPTTQKVKRKGRKPKRKTVATTALAGGFQTTVSFVGAPSIRGVFIGESRRVNGVWRASGVSLGNQNAELKAFAYCGA